MTAGGQQTGTALVVVVLVALVLGAGLGSALRAVVLARVAASGGARARLLGTAWVNVPAAGLAAALLVWQTRLGPAPGGGPSVAGTALVLLLGACGGLSTWSALALELARSVLDGDRRALVVQVLGVVLGVLGGVFGAGVAVLALLLAG